MDKITHGVLECAPRFILEDRNTYALARTMDILTARLCRDIADADICLTDPEQMPEWALDEYAYGLGVAWYDKSADIETKRKWLIEVHDMRCCVGTKDAIHRLLLGFYGNCDVEENWQYGGEPFHFRVIVSGEWSQERAAWARNAIEQAKNVRSIFDGLHLGRVTRISVRGEGSVVARFPYEITGLAELEEVEPPTQDDSKLLLDEDGNGWLTGAAIAVDAEGRGTINGATLIVDADGHGLIE